MFVSNLVKKRLIIVSASSRLKREPKEPIPAIDRFDGIYFRTLRKYIRMGKLRNTDVLILSEKYGLISSREKIQYQQPHMGKYGSLSLNQEAANNLRSRNLQRLKKIVNQYEEVYVNVGKGYRKLINGFENFATGTIIYASGRGLGPKARHMKEWILAHS